MKVTFERLENTPFEPKLPTRATDGAAGYDVYSVDKLVIEPGERRVVGSGWRMQLPYMYEAQVRPRSGLAFRYGITVLNAPGTIDCDYRGELKVMLYNTSKIGYEVKPGDRIAQLVFAPVTVLKCVEGKIYDDTERGEGGFGSTGK